MLAQLWNGGYILDWAGLVLEFTGAALAAFGILPARSHSPGIGGDDLRTSPAFQWLQSKQIRFGFVALAAGCLLQGAGTFQAALPLFAK